MHRRAETRPMHPAVMLTYACIAMVLAMAFCQPALCAVAFAGVASFGLAADGWRKAAKRLSWQLSVVAFVVVMNGLFVQRGATVLLDVGPLSVHAESLAYGACMGLSLATVVEAFALLGELASSDDVLAMGARRFPACSLLASMTLRLVPKMRREAREHREAVAACTAARLEGTEPARGGSGGSAAAPVPGAFPVADFGESCDAAPGLMRRDPCKDVRLRKSSRLMSALLDVALEDSIVTADSMRARGFGCGAARTSYERRSFRAEDGVALAVVLAFGAAAAAAGIAASSGFAFYPHIRGGADVLQVAVFVPFFLLPHVAFACARLRERRG